MQDVQVEKSLSSGIHAIPMCTLKSVSEAFTHDPRYRSLPLSSVPHVFLIVFSGSSSDSEAHLIDLSKHYVTSQYHPAQKYLYPKAGLYSGRRQLFYTCIHLDGLTSQPLYEGRNVVPFKSVISKILDLISVISKISAKN